MSNSGNVKVVCRVRPLNAKEIAKGSKCCLDFHKDGKQIAINLEGGSQQNKFEFDHVFDTNSQQKDVYDISARPIIDSVLDGFNGTIFAYG